MMRIRRSLHCISLLSDAAAAGRAISPPRSRYTRTAVTRHNTRREMTDKMMTAVRHQIAAAARHASARLPPFSFSAQQWLLKNTITYTWCRDEQCTMFRHHHLPSSSPPLVQIATNKYQAGPTAISGTSGWPQGLFENQRAEEMTIDSRYHRRRQ